MAALPGPAFEFADDRIEGDAARAQQHQEMIEHVGGLRAHRRLVLRRRRDRQLDRLLAELPGAMSRALVQQASRVGFLGRRVRAPVDDLREVVESEHDFALP